MNIDCFGGAGRTENCSMECIHHLDRMLSDPHSGVTKPAVVVVEPIQGEGGSIVPPERFLPPLVISETLLRKAVEIFSDDVREIEKNPSGEGEQEGKSPW